MKRFLRGFRTQRDLREREEKQKLTDAQCDKIRKLLTEGGHEAEADYVHAVKDWMPNISKEQLQDKIKRFHAAVSERQLRDRESR